MKKLGELIKETVSEYYSCFPMDEKHNISNLNLIINVDGTEYSVESFTILEEEIICFVDTK